MAAPARAAGEGALGAEASFSRLAASRLARSRLRIFAKGAPAAAYAAVPARIDAARIANACMAMVGLLNRSSYRKSC